MLFYDHIFLFTFAAFFPVYFLLKGRARLSLTLAVSYFVYGWFSWRFLVLMIASTIVDYAMARAIDHPGRTLRQKRWLLAVSMASNLGILGFFKYYNFFVDSFVAAFGVTSAHGRFLVEVALPPGISFYTFQAMSYVLDVYRGRFRAERSFVAFATYLAYFPQLVAGPIVRPDSLLPQLHAEPRFRWANVYAGLRLFVCGLFKKLVIADNLAPLSDAAFADPGAQSVLGLMIGAWCFAIQIYCDFSGYSDMARGLARSMGISLTRNFNLPYLAASLGEFWRRWHITLSYWLRDYVYIPLGGSRHGFWLHVRNLLVTFTLSGLWHGASWTFVLWGLFHGLWITGELVVRRLGLPALPRALRILVTVHVVVLLWVLFRAKDLKAALLYYQTLFAGATPLWRPEDDQNLGIFLIYTLPLLAFSLWQYHRGSLQPDTHIRSRIAHASALGAMLFLTILLGAENGAQFIYFQF